MSRRHARVTPSPSFIDRDWPHQVALPDDICVDVNYGLIRQFCEENGLKHHTRSVTAVWPGRLKQEHWRLHCFADRAHAEVFQAHFGGYLFDPKRDREGGKVRGAWLREGEYKRMLESGPLSVPRVLRG